MAEDSIPDGLLVVPSKDGHRRLDPEKIDDIGVLCEYTLTAP